MANNYGIITAPVRLPTDVSAVLGIPATDLGTACTSPYINKWSKYKPLNLNAIDTITGQWDAANNTWLASATWWKGNPHSGVRRPQYTCGLIINCYDNDRASFKAAIDNGNGGWGWDAPTGGSSSPFRLQDFAGYSHRSDSLLEGYTCPSEVPPNQQFSIVIEANTLPDRYMLSLNDIFENSSANRIWFFGVICYNGNTKEGEINSRIPIGLTDELIDGVSYTWREIKLKAPASTGTYKLYPCIMYNSNFSNNPSGLMDNTSTPATQTFVALPLPQFAPITVTITPNTANKEWMSVYATFRIVYTDDSQTTIDYDRTKLNIQIISTAGTNVASVSRTNTITMMFGNNTFSGFITQSETFTYSGSSNNPHYYGDSGGTMLTYAAFSGGSDNEKKMNMSTAIEQARNGNAYIYVNQNNSNNISSPVKASIGLLNGGGGVIS